MAKKEHYYERFEPECHYHVYNRCVGQKAMFVSEANHRFFLKQYDAYLSPLVETYSYALMSNHFHLGIKIRPVTELDAFRGKNQVDNHRYADTHALISHQFQRFFQSYSMAFNKEQKRIGTLMQTPFKRCFVEEKNLPWLMIYHHLNPIKHRFTDDFTSYAWTSYRSYLSDLPSKLPRSTVMDLFGGKEMFVKRHMDTRDDLLIGPWVIDDTEV
jgi:putative transposase